MNDIKLLLKSFSERPIAYYPIYAKITGSITAGILLNQCCYWFYSIDNKEFYKTDKEFCDDLSIGLYELKSAKKRLQELGLISLKRRGVPAKTFYQLHEDILITLITSYGKNPQLVSGKTNNLLVEKPITITETTTEITTEINLKSCVSGDSPEIASSEVNNNPNLTTSDTKQFIDYAFTSFNNKFGRKLNIVGAKDGSLVKRLCKTYTLDELKIYWDAYLDMDDEFFARVGHTIAVFSSSINKVGAWYNQREKSNRTAYSPSYYKEMT